jgi:hypothetical protein
MPFSLGVIKTKEVRSRFLGGLNAEDRPRCGIEETSCWQSSILWLSMKLQLAESAGRALITF